MIDKEKLIPKLDKWSKALKDMDKFGIIQHQLTTFQMDDKKLFALEGMDKSELTISNRYGNDFPYQVSLEVEQYILYTILSAEEYAKHFPEKIEMQGDSIVIDGVKYRKEVQYDF
jgi:hypothetical protein